jgi:lysophospholipase L1-like esterase
MTGLRRAIPALLVALVLGACGSDDASVQAGHGASGGSGGGGKGGPTTTTDAPAPGDDLPPPKDLKATFIGDSVADAVAETPAARRVISRGLGRMTLDLAVCRRLVAASCTYNGKTPSSALEAVKSHGDALGKVLVVDAGYNDGAEGYDDAIDDIVRTAKAHGVERVVWVTLREAGTYPQIYKVSNGVIRRARARWPQLRVADWNAYSAGKDWFGSDGLHLSTTGAVALARFLRPYVTGER